MSYRESKKYKSQKSIVKQFLSDKTATASMVEVATGIHQKCITWIKVDLQQNGHLWEVEKKHCKVTGRLAWYITTDPSLKPIDRQYSFDW